MDSEEEEVIEEAEAGHSEVVEVVVVVILDSGAEGVVEEVDFLEAAVISGLRIPFWVSLLLPSARNVDPGTLNI